MTHDGAGLDTHLQALHDHAAAQRAEAHQAALGAHEQLEAERAAQGEDDGSAPSSPPASA